MQDKYKGQTREELLVPVHVSPNRPKDYHGWGKDWKYSKPFLGELIKPDGTNYSRLEKRVWMVNTAHIAMTPLHAARLAIQRLTKKNDWVLDPFAGSGTTGVEALLHGRNFAGVELEFGDIFRDNMRWAFDYMKRQGDYYAEDGDAREIGVDLKKQFGKKKPFKLIYTNPPYLGDETSGSISDNSPLNSNVKRLCKSGTKMLKYNNYDVNLAGLRNGEEYFATLRSIFAQCIQFLKPNGHVVIAVKDTMLAKKPFPLHEKIGDVLSDLRLNYQGLYLLRHYPTTLFINTYRKFHGAEPTRFQSMLVFKKGK